MFYSNNLSTVRAALGALLLTFIAACSDVPSGLRQPVPKSSDEQAAAAPADRALSEVVTLRSITADGDGKIRRDDFSTTTQRGIAILDGERFGAEGSATKPVSLRMWDAGSMAVPAVRRAHSNVRLPDGQVAIVDREFTADGAPTTMRVRVGNGEFTWRRAWARQGNRSALVSSEIESRLHGTLVARSVLSVQSRRVAGVRSFHDQLMSRRLLAMSHRFGSLAGTVLLPRALHAQTDGMVCNGAATALKAAWTAWRIATVLWAASTLLGGTLKATTLEFTASAAVDTAEAYYIDCYVAATAAGVPDYRIAPPPVEDEL